MRHCLSCQQPILTLQDLRRERRRDGALVIAALLIAATLFGSLGYLVRGGVFLKRENSVLWKLVNAYVGKVEVDKVVDQNTGLRGQVRAGRGKEKKGGE